MKLSEETYTTQNMAHPEWLDEGYVGDGGGWYIGGMANLQGRWGYGPTVEEAEADFIEAVRGMAGITENE